MLEAIGVSGEQLVCVLKEHLECVFKHKTQTRCCFERQTTPHGTKDERGRERWLV